MSGTPALSAMDSKVKMLDLEVIVVTLSIFETGFAQKRYPNGTFSFTDPINCSPNDNSNQACSLQSTNTNGFYESSSWEYSWYVLL